MGYNKLIMRTYNTKRRVIFTLVAIFLCLSSLSLILHFSRHDYKALVPAVGFLFFALFFAQAKPKVVTTNEFIETGLFSFGQACNWDWIYNIKTFRESRTQRYWTVLSWSKETGSRSKDWKELFKFKPKSGTIIVTEQLENYADLLKEIKEKATHAEIDLTTDKIAQTGRIPD